MRSVWQWSTSEVVMPLQVTMKSSPTATVGTHKAWGQVAVEGLEGVALRGGGTDASECDLPLDTGPQLGQ